MRCTRPNHIGSRELPYHEWDDRGRCRACLCRLSREHYYRKLGVAADPPDGFVRVSVAADRLGLTHGGLSARLRQGWMAQHVWRRGTRGLLYLNVDAVIAAGETQ